MTLPSPRTDLDSDAGVSRRSLLSRSAASGLGIAFVGSIDGLFGTTAAAEPGGGRGKPGAAGYGPLVPDPDGILSLPAGFTYTIIAEIRRDGARQRRAGPRRPGRCRVLRPPRRKRQRARPEPRDQRQRARTACRSPRGFVYDPKAGGGTTNIEVDKDGTRMRQYVSLAGTHNNCAGGRTPWQTWLTCEETRGHAGGRQAPRLRVRGRPLRPGGQPRPEADQGARAGSRTSRSSSTRTPASSTRPRTPAARTGWCSAGRRRSPRCRSARARCAGSPTTRGRSRR